MPDRTLLDRLPDRLLPGRSPSLTGSAKTTALPSPPSQVLLPAYAQLMPAEGPATENSRRRPPSIARGAVTIEILVIRRPKFLRGGVDGSESHATAPAASSDSACAASARVK